MTGEARRHLEGPDDHALLFVAIEAAKKGAAIDPR